MKIERFIARGDKENGGELFSPGVLKQSPTETIIEESIKIEKMPVPQIESKSGVSADYLNEVVAVHGLLDGIIAGDYNVEDTKDLTDLAMNLAFLKKKFDAESPSRLKKYTERFSPETYANVVNEKNANAVVVLDTYVDSLYDLFSNELRAANLSDRMETLREAYMICKEITNMVRNGTPAEKAELTEI